MNSLFTGENFDLEGFKLVPQYIYVGDKDDNDAFSCSAVDGGGQLICAVFGDPQYIWECFPIAQQIYDSVGAMATFKIHPGIGHSVTQEMYLDVNTFFEQSWYPLIQITNPAGNPTCYTDQATIDITGTAVDDINITQVTCLNNRGGVAGLLLERLPGQLAEWFYIRMKTLLQLLRGMRLRIVALIR
jgi:hypothetical protein